MHGVFQFLVISDPAFIEQVITERIEKLVASERVLVLLGEVDGLLAEVISQRAEMSLTTSAVRSRRSLCQSRNSGDALA